MNTKPGLMAKTKRGVRRLKARAQRGYGLLEIAIGLVLVAGIAAGIMMFYQNAQNNNRTNDAIAQIAAIQSAVQGLYHGQPTYSGLTTANIATSGALPNKMIANTNQLRSPFNTSVFVTTTGVFDTYTIEIEDVGSEPCLRLVSQDFGRNVARLATELNTTGVVRRAMSVSEAQTACGNDRADIMWTFY